MYILPNSRSPGYSTIQHNYDLDQVLIPATDAFWHFCVVGSRLSSDRRSAMSSETRAPLLYKTVSIIQSQRLTHVASDGTASIVSTCSLVR